MDMMMGVVMVVMMMHNPRNHIIMDVPSSHMFMPMYTLEGESVTMHVVGDAWKDW